MQTIEPTDRELAGAQRQFLIDIMTTAVETGIGYWVGEDDTSLKNVNRNPDLDIVDFDIYTGSVGTLPLGKTMQTVHITPELIAGVLDFIVHPDRDPQHPDIKWHHAHWAQFAGWHHHHENIDFDADDADNIIQIAVFGEVVYG